MEQITSLTHITDVGSSQGDGVDSTLRIKKQYERVGFSAEVVTPGQSPFRVAFTACTELSAQARENAAAVVELLGIPKPTPKPLALNSAPRNSAEPKPNGAEDYIYRVKSSNGGETLLIYGPEVLSLVLSFRGRVGTTVERIISIEGIIKNTSNGLQFRSGEHLPLVHAIEACNRLNTYRAVIEAVDLDTIPKGLTDDGVIIAPPDEYKNCRVIVHTSISEEIFSASSGRDSIKIHGLSQSTFAVRDSLTQVEPGELAIWKSSNHFPNPEFQVLNIGTRWKPGKTETTDEKVEGLWKHCSGNVGKNYSLNV